MAKPGTTKHPAAVRVRTIERAHEIVSLCESRGWHVIAGLEPDKPEDISDVKKLLRGAPKRPAVPRPPPRVGPNDCCPCRSGLKYKKCCGAVKLQ
jgi:SWIM/SEC-C metal-binding protein